MAKDNPIAKAAYTIREFGKAYGIGRSTVYVEMKAGRLKARKAGGRVLVMAEDAKAWADALPEYTPGEENVAHVIRDASRPNTGEAA